MATSTFNITIPKFRLNLANCSATSLPTFTGNIHFQARRLSTWIVAISIANSKVNRFIRMMPFRSTALRLADWKGKTCPTTLLPATACSTFTSNIHFRNWNPNSYPLLVAMWPATA